MAFAALACVAGCGGSDRSAEPAAQTAEVYDVVILGGTISDGSGGAPYGCPVGKRAVALGTRATVEVVTGSALREFFPYMNLLLTGKQ